MKRFFKVFGVSIATIFVIADILFCTLVPNIIHLENYKADLQKIVNEQTKMSLEYKSAKITTTPLFSAGIIIEDISLKLPDGSLLFSSDLAKARVSLPSLLLFTLKISCFEIDKPFLNFEIAQDNSDFKIVKLVEDILNEKKQAEFEHPKTETQKQDEMAFNLSKIRIKIPNIILKDYKVLIKDLHSNHSLDLKGNELRLGYFNGKSAKIKTFAQIHSDENVNINANIDIHSFLPQLEPSLDEEDDKAQMVEIPFVNPVEMYRNYDLKANLYTKLRIKKDRNGKITSYGYFDLENVTMKISQILLPESYIKAKAMGDNIWFETNISATKNQNLALSGKVKYGKNPLANMHIKTDKIYFNDLIILTKAFLDSLHLPNELKQISASGFLEADATIKTNFKKLRSSGAIAIKDGAVKVRNLGNIISDANINILLNNNILDIKNSHLFVNGSKILIEGNIDKKSVANINIKAEPIALNKLFYAFAPENIRNSYNFTSGNLTFNYSLRGKLKNAINDADFTLKNLKLSDRKNSFAITNDNLSGSLQFGEKSINANIINNNFLFLITKTKSKILSNKLEISANNDNIEIKENKIFFNDKSAIRYSGYIADYTKKTNINFTADGELNTSDLIKFIGKELSPYIHYNGNIPLELSFAGNSKKQTLFIRTTADAGNYITPVDIKNLEGKKSALQTIIDFKPNRIKIKKTGLYTISTQSDAEGNLVENLNEIFSADGTIAKNTINLLKISVPEALNAKLHLFPKSSFTINPSKIFIFGQTDSPVFIGNLSIDNLDIPEILTKIGNTQINLTGHRANFALNKIFLNGSDINISGDTNLLPESIFKIFNFNLTSKLIDVDKIMTVTEKLSTALPQQPSSGNGTSSADIPIIINNGNLNIDKIKTGNINVSDIYSNIILKNNILYLNNLTSHVFDGVTGGNVSLNLLTSLLKIDMSGAGINVAKAMEDAAGMKDMLSGKASFKANIELSGSTYEEQMKNLTGDISFSATNGQFGPFGKIENLILAENIRESEFFQTALGGIIDSLATIDTTHFEELKGALSFENGICHISEITSAGKILALHVFGDYNLLANTTDMKVRAKMTSLLSNLLGPIAMINPVNLLSSAAGMNVVTAKAFSLFCETLPEEEISTLPNFSNKYLDDSSMKFQLVVRGDVAKPLTLVKSFKWLATALEFKKADEFVAAIPDIQEGSTATTIEEAIKEHEALEAKKKTFGYKVKHIFIKDKNTKKQNQY